MGSSNGLIIAFVVVVWAAYFIPLALRRYDDASKHASIETDGSRSRVIARPKTVVQEPVVEPVEKVQAAATVAPARDRPAAQLAAKRRRRTLLTLLAVLVVVGGLAGFAVIAAYWVVVPVALVAAWLVACRIQVRGELGIAATWGTASKATMAKVSASKVSAPKISLPRLHVPHFSAARLRTSAFSRTVAEEVTDEEETIVVTGLFEDINPGRKNLMEHAELEADALDDQIVIAVPSVSTTGEALWDPLPVTLPTYVTKPRAGRTVRTIEFGQAGAWTSGHIEGEDVELPHRRDAVEADHERHAVGH
ncbi:hypothetical protein [Aeromicrobium sp.]|uniref:divisome protein SepX/GlpR n=1 Tax=Aeromicrobium sp. TaxID=1871063 RepID=UPI00198AFF9A|nr:hypothetical protein [Aeromicrobium sp.]MBC7631027.1 hypothetical protein [Aeromicrobium sp.]